MIIMKFGGSSIKDTQAMKRVANIVLIRQNKQPLVVLSALKGVTDELIQLYQQAAKKNKHDWINGLSKLKERHQSLFEQLVPLFGQHESHWFDERFRELESFLEVTSSLNSKNDAVYYSVIGMGERLSSFIFTAYLNALNISAEWFDIRPVMKLEMIDGEVVPNRKAIKKMAKRYLNPRFSDHSIMVTQGFIGTDSQDAPLTLGRDGSDYSASLLGEALNAEEIQIWSDVNGILSADPSIIKNARSLGHMSFDEACELAYFGARVLHPAAIQPAIEKGIPVRVLNSLSPDEEGTKITAETTQPGTKPIRSIAYKENISLITVESSRLLLSPRLIERVFDILNHYNIIVYTVSKAATKLALTILNGIEGQSFLTDLETFGKVSCLHHKAVVSMVGEGLKDKPELRREMEQLLYKQGIAINLIPQFQNAISAMFIIDEAEIKRTITILHQRFIMENTYRMAVPASSENT